MISFVGTILIRIFVSALNIGIYISPVAKREPIFSSFGGSKLIVRNSDCDGTGLRMKEVKRGDITDLEDCNSYI